MLGGLASGHTVIRKMLRGADNLATLSAFKALGIAVEDQGDTVVIHGGPLQAPEGDLDLGNSGTAIRLMAGVLAGQPFNCVLTGDESLTSRPMGRIIKPLRQMGAVIDSADQGRAPLRIQGRALHGVQYQSPIASAQVKSAVLFAGLRASGPVTVTEPHRSRDHSERMLAAFGADIRVDGLTVTLQPNPALQGQEVVVPGDISSAAFFIGYGLLAQTTVKILGVGMNPTRTGIIDILRRMGANIDVRNSTEQAGEPVADLIVHPSPLHGVEISGDDVVRAIDEFPLVFCLAAQAQGRTTICGAEELRVKESDRIAVMATALRTLGVDIVERPDGAVIDGGNPLLADQRVDAAGDHRCAMALSVLAAASQTPVLIDGCHNVDTSYPQFVEHAESVGIEVSSL